MVKSDLPRRLVLITVPQSKAQGSVGNGPDIIVRTLKIRPKSALRYPTIPPWVALV